METKKKSPRVVRGTASIYDDDRIEFNPYAQGETTQLNVKTCKGNRVHPDTLQELLGLPVLFNDSRRVVLLLPSASGKKNHDHDDIEDPTHKMLISFYSKYSASRNALAFKSFSLVSTSCWLIGQTIPKSGSSNRMAASAWGAYTLSTL